jgi:hypothetical protein
LLKHGVNIECINQILLLPRHIFWLFYNDATKMRGAQWLRHYATTRKVVGSIPDGVAGFFSLTSFRPHYGPGFDSACNRMRPRNISWG